MDEKILQNILEEIDDHQMIPSKCRDLQEIIYYCRENFDDWKNIKLYYIISFQKKSISIDINDFEYDFKNRVLLLLNNDLKKEDLTIKDLDNFLNYLKTEEDDWGDNLLICDNFSNPNTCFVDESENKICFLS
jgi:hypothetical protein